jgi:ABC-type molybdenum transport system ATPase subunit/photorepair protein PhrA
MKIYFIGSESSGKTTLARYTANKLKLPMLTEVARTVLAERELSVDSLRTNIDIVNSYQEEVFLRQIKEENKITTGFVSDRSFDNLAYAANYSTIFSKLMASDECIEYIQKIKKEISSGETKIFFVRPCKSILKNDGVRETVFWENAVAIDAMIKMLTQLFDIKCIHIYKDSMQERVQLLDAVIGF